MTSKRYFRIKTFVFDKIKWCESCQVNFTLILILQKNVIVPSDFRQAYGERLGN